ncbi:MAG: DUF1415 domain-containing protein [Pseudomonadota bacterium]
MDSIIQAVVVWLNSVVIGLNLCPFSAKPTRENRVRFQVSLATDEESLLEDLMFEMELLDKTSSADIETTLLIAPQVLHDFFDYNQFLIWAESRIKSRGWKGIYQLASFHPQYCFAGAEADAVENLTNRSPYPILHIIREESLTAALNYIHDVEGIPERNKKRVQELTTEEKYSLFPYLFRP